MQIGSMTVSAFIVVRLESAYGCQPDCFGYELAGVYGQVRTYLIAARDMVCAMNRYGQ